MRRVALPFLVVFGLLVLAPAPAALAETTFDTGIFFQAATQTAAPTSTATPAPTPTVAPTAAPTATPDDGLPDTGSETLLFLTVGTWSIFVGLLFRRVAVRREEREAERADLDGYV